MPVPVHIGQGLVEPSSMPGRKRWRDISIKPEMADAPDLDARAVVAERFLKAPLD